MVSLGDLIWDVYEDRIRSQFANHPNADELITRMKAGDLSFEEIDTAFAEADAYSMRSIVDRFTNKPDSSGTVTFEIYKGE